MATGSSKRNEQQLSKSLEPFFALKEIQSLDKMIQSHQKMITDQELRIAKLQNLRSNKEKDLIDADIELDRLSKNYILEEKSNQLITRDLTQAQTNIMAATNDHELKAANAQISTKKPLKEKSDQTLYELLTTIEEKEQEIKDLKSFMEGSLKTLSEITTEVQSLISQEKSEIENLETRINLLTNSLPEHFKTKFSSINKKYRFKSPITIVDNNHCKECYFIISRNQMASLDKANTIELCPQCERILLPSGAY